MVEYSFAFYAFDQIDTSGLDANYLTDTVAVGGSFTVNSGAVLTDITVNDDDDIFHDGYIDPQGAASQTLVNPITINGTTYNTGDVVELEFRIDTDSGESFYFLRIDGVNVGILGTTQPDPGTTYTIDPEAVSGEFDGQAIPFDSIACFTRGTRITTKEGDKCVEELKVGDLIKTLDHGYQPLRWIGHRNLSAQELEQHPNLAPILFKPGSRGNSAPLMVSPQHRMLVNDWRVELHFGCQSVLAPAKSLINDDDIVQVQPECGVVYYHLLFDDHQIIFGEGVASESFHPSGSGLDGFSRLALAELLQLFPELESLSSQSLAAPAVKCREIRAALDLAS
ncbi:hypothetical protein GCM10011517_18350 [Actibacterium pelagium]|uniref:Hedgehog/Intein (Hint) domain-containing protein n=2 Tax=Actibacterium pelagium TaxID=2029103 RepID=A0A917EIZ9_9RHOB|nr:Hint domain-containing protein [Actibacterium pelagium]GGE50919.1 hypothetical protein GCM10011517_18350 [Actibacterium pelagium]